MRILSNQFRACQVWTRFAARRVFAMAESALRAELHSAFANLVRRIVLWGNRFWPGLGGRALALRALRAGLRIRLAKSDRSLRDQDAGDPELRMISGPGTPIPEPAPLALRDAGSVS